MRFRPDAKLDPSQVTECGAAARRPCPRRRRRTRASSGSSYSSSTSCSAGVAAASGPRQPRRTVGLDGHAVHLAQDCRTGRTPTSARTAASSPTSTASSATGLAPSRGYSTPRRPSSTPTRSQTGCGYATPQVGPFYCPADKQVYIDLGFFDELRAASARRAARSRRRTSSPTSTAITCRTSRRRSDAPVTGSGPEGGSVRMELQADCYAGVWADHAVETGLIDRT